MIRLKNIKKSNHIIESDILPENSKMCGHIVVNLKTNELEKFVLPEGYEWCRKHVNHAKDKLIELSKQEIIPEEKLIMWC